MAILDLRCLADAHSTTCDVAIVGAGAAGLLLAATLAQQGVAVAVLEAGGSISAGEQKLGAEAVVEGGVYRATREGRAFGLGGTTALWGGQIVPHSEFDFRAQEAGFDFWRHLVAIVERRAGAVCATLGLTPTCRWFHAAECIPPAAVAALRGRGLEIVTGDWLPFRRRNLAFLAERGTFDVYLNAPACGWEIATEAGGAARIRSVTARAGEKTLSVQAREYVLAAGAIESTRVLLEIERSLGREFRAGSELGRGLADHLSCRVADVLPEDLGRCAETFAPRFRSGRMRSFRFVERGAPPGSPRGFFHFIFDTENAGFALARKVLQGVQGRAMPRVTLAEAVRGAAGIGALGWERFVRRRLHVPRGRPAHLQLDIEQARNPGNRIALSDSRDAAGRPRASVQWSVSRADEEAIQWMAAGFLAAWGGAPALPRLAAALGDASSLKPHDVYHPVGTCRMGTDAGAVVDPESRVHGAANLSVASTAVFPSAGTANPTFSMLCLAAELAERVAAKPSSPG
jgi:choline dehydrogenase-like flavoprotein